MPDVHGNLAGLRDSLLAEMKTLYDLELPGDCFAPAELISVLASYSAKINREIALYLTRDGEIVDLIIGQLDSVSLPDYRLRRNVKRLSGVRCVHTHPGGVGELSDVDISALRSLRFDAMCAIGVREGCPREVQAGFLAEMEKGVNRVDLLPPVPWNRIPQSQWMALIGEADEKVLAGEAEGLADGPERAVLVGVESEASLDELERLADTAGARVVGRALQKRLKPDGATFIGSGKAGELALDCQALEADLCIFDEELTGIQTRNLEEILGVKVIDRTTLILDIFAQRASSREGKLQVELAQLNYQSSRLIGQGLVLSRLAGGIGTRGPGESRLEMNRRRIRERVTDLKRELEQVERQRSLRRKSREKNAIPLVALVGYTNAGKSTLLNQLSGAGVYVKDQLFATLDAVSRRVALPDGGECLLVDTVGFIRKLPHTLVSAFRSTLEEAALADVLLIVSDGASPEMMKQHEVVEEVLAQLGAVNQPRIEVVNKSDLGIVHREELPGALYVSARQGENMEALLQAVGRALHQTRRPVTLLIPFSQYGLLAQVRPLGRIISETHEETGTRLTLLLTQEDVARLTSRWGNTLFPSESE